VPQFADGAGVGPMIDRFEAFGDAARNTRLARGSRHRAWRKRGSVVVQPLGHLGWREFLSC